MFSRRIRVEPLRFSFVARVCLLGVIVVPLATRAVAEDWPRWRGAAANGHITATTAVPTTLPKEARYVWKKKIGAGVGSPVVSGGHVFYLDNRAEKETVHKVDAATGAERWSAEIDDVFKDMQTTPGPRGTPLVDGERVFVQSARGEFKCLSVADGKPLWRVNFVADFAAEFTGETGITPGAARHGNTASPIVEGDRIFVNVGGSKGASVVCFDKCDGKVLWKSQDDIPGFGGPVIATLAGVKQVLTFTSQAVIGLDFATGAPLWRVPVKTSYGRHVLSPIVSGDIVLVSSHQVGLLGIKISRRGDSVIAEEAFNEKRLAINFASPVEHRGFLYGLGQAGMLFCAEMKTGKEMWSQEIPGAGKKEHAAFIVMNDTLLVLTEAGDLLLIAADPKAFRLISQLKISGDNWCNPAYADGKLFTRDAEELICVQLLP